MSLHGEYDRDNIFAKILRKEAPAVIVHEDDETLSFMDVFPQSPGHVLVVPKTPARNLLDIDDDALAGLAKQAKRIAAAVEKAFAPDGVFVAQFNGEEAGQTVFHIHVHIIPRYAGRPMQRHGGDMADMAELQSQAAAIAKALA